ncbi:putative ABC exporter domain-containing protein [Clostridium rectalis]|uniref:putative ABC exporter domain-containing protein n=1 Tax=Clostridium rectalis TaxID=2040295 RepID=UPI000F630F83|nr:putative ABC exporter domain-containing protein [Clostridium rectalis]
MNNEVIKDFKNLTYMELLKIKNTFLYYIKNPVAGLKKLALTLLPLVFLIYGMFIGNKTGTKKLNFKITPEMEGAIILTILLIILLYTLNKSVDKYNPGQFKLSDAYYLFTSPIGSRIIYAFTMFRSFFIDILSAIFYMFIYIAFLGNFTSSNDNKKLYMVITFLLLTIFLRGIKFLVYTLSTRFNLRGLLKILIRVSTLIIVLYIGFSIDYKENILGSLVKVINGSIFSKFTIVGWAKDIILYESLYGIKPIFEITALTLVTASTLLLGIYFATDYYEEAVLYAESIDKILTSNKNIHDYMNADNGQKLKKVKKVNAKEYKGEWAFIWKNNIMNKRRVNPLTKIMSYSVCVIISILIGLFVKDTKNFTAIYVFVFISLSTVATSITNNVLYELKKQHVFLLPGRPAYKILAISYENILNNTLSSIFLTLPSMLFSTEKKGYIIGICILLIVTGIINYFVGVISRILVGVGEGKSSILNFILQVVFLSLPMISAGYLGQKLSSVNLAIIIFLVVSFIILSLMFVIIDKLFYRLEL